MPCVCRCEVEFCFAGFCHSNRFKFSPRHHLELIARNGHRLRDMGLGTSRHEDDQLSCRRSRMICGRPRAACWDRKERRAVWENSCSQVQVDFDAQTRECAVELEPAWICVEVRRDEQSGFVVDSTRAWPPHRIAGVEGVRLARRLQVE